MKYYVHGYTDDESKRLYDQAKTLRDIFHAKTYYPPGSRVLEAGCGVGAQTAAIAEQSPGAKITSVDFSAKYLLRARDLITAQGDENVNLIRADLFELPFKDGTFDHLFVCFVLEHLPDPKGALELLKRALKPGGTVTVIEGDHGSWFFHPESESALKVCDALVVSQRKLGGNPDIGRELYPLVRDAGFHGVSVEPLFIYSDASRPEMAEGFVHNTIIAMVEGVRERAISDGLLTRDEWKKGIDALTRTAERDGTFCYTFFRATAHK